MIQLSARGSRVQGVKKRTKVRGTIALKQVQGWDEGREHYLTFSSE